MVGSSGLEPSFFVTVGPYYCWSIRVRSVPFGGLRKTTEEGIFLLVGLLFVGPHSPEPLWPPSAACWRVRRSPAQRLRKPRRPRLPVAEWRLLSRSSRRPIRERSTTS